MVRFLTITVLLTVLAGPAGWCQPHPTPGSKVRITLDYHPRGERFRTFTATITRVFGPDSVQVDLLEPLSDGASTTTILTSHIEQLEVRAGSARSTTTGIIIGSALGLAAGSAIAGMLEPKWVCDSSLNINAAGLPSAGEYDCHERSAWALVRGRSLLGVAIGALTGAIVGGQFSHDVWIAVELTPPSGLPTSRRPERLGVTVSVSH